jgi:tetraacyldisaccharide 4'-kinase
VVAVCGERLLGMKRLKQAFPDLQVVILDDAFQHRRIRCGLNILLTPADSLYVDDHYLPYGRLRDAKNQSLRADMIVVTKCPKGLKPIEKRLIDTRLHLPSYQSLFFSTIDYPTVEAGERTMLVTAIARPEYLEEHLRTIIPNLETLCFPDHHVLSRNELHFLEQKAKYYDRILTTEKDMARLEEAPLSDALREKLVPIPILTQIDQHEAFDRQVMTYVRENVRKR